MEEEQKSYNNWKRNETNDGKKRTGWNNLSPGDNECTASMEESLERHHNNAHSSASSHSGMCVCLSAGVISTLLIAIACLASFNERMK